MTKHIGWAESTKIYTVNEDGFESQCKPEDSAKAKQDARASSGMDVEAQDERETVAKTAKSAIVGSNWQFFGKQEEPEAANGVLGGQYIK